MLEMWDFSAIIAVSVVSSAVVSALVYVLFSWSLRGEMRSLIGAVRGRAGVDKKAEQMAEMESAVAEAMIAMKTEGTPAQKAQALAAVAAKYPRVALKLGQKVGIGQISDLLGLGGD